MPPSQGVLVWLCCWSQLLVSADQDVAWQTAGSDDEVTSTLHPAKSALLLRSSPSRTKLPVGPSMQSFWARASSNQWLALQQAAELSKLVGADFAASYPCRAAKAQGQPWPAASLVDGAVVGCSLRCF